MKRTLLLSGVVTSVWLGALLGGALPAAAEAWPMAPQLGAMASLIVRVEVGPGPEGGSRFAVREVWKGSYSPTNFTAQPPAGCILVNGSGGRLAGEFLLCYAAHNHRTTLGSYDMSLPIQDGQIAYPPPGTREFSVATPYRLEEFKRALQLADAEAAPAKRLPVTFDIMARDAVLIVHCRAEMVQGRTLGKVQEVWRGTYAPADFERPPPPGFVDVRMGTPKPGDQTALREGTELIVFWHRLNQAGGGLRQFYLVPVKDGKVSQEIHRSGLREELTVAELKERVSRPPAKPGK